MPTCSGENVEVTFTCPGCRQTVGIWAFVPVHPDSSNTEILPAKWRGQYRQDWYVNPTGNRLFEAGQLFQVELVDNLPILTAVDLVVDDNPYVNDLPLIPEEGIGRDKVLWICPTCLIQVESDRTVLWKIILARLAAPS